MEKRDSTFKRENLVYLSNANISFGQKSQWYGRINFILLPSDVGEKIASVQRKFTFVNCKRIFKPEVNTKQLNFVSTTLS